MSGQFQFCRSPDESRGCTACPWVRAIISPCIDIPRQFSALGVQVDASLTSERSLPSCHAGCRNVRTPHGNRSRKERQDEATSPGRTRSSHNDGSYAWGGAEELE